MPIQQSQRVNVSILLVEWNVSEPDPLELFGEQLPWVSKQCCPSWPHTSKGLHYGC